MVANARQAVTCVHIKSPERMHASRAFWYGHNNACIKITGEGDQGKNPMAISPMRQCMRSHVQPSPIRTIPSASELLLLAHRTPADSCISARGLIIAWISFAILIAMNHRRWGIGLCPHPAPKVNYIQLCPEYNVITAAVKWGDLQKSAGFW